MRFNKLYEKKANPEQTAVSSGVQTLGTDQWMGTYKFSKDVAGHDGKKQHAPESPSGNDVYTDKPVVVGFSDADDKMTKAAMNGKVKQTVGPGSEEPKTVNKSSPLSKNEDVSKGLPDHLKKHFDKDGNPIKGSWKDGKWTPNKDSEYQVKDVTPKGYGPTEDVEEANNIYHLNRTGFARGPRDSERHDLDVSRPAPQEWALKINGKVWSKDGKAVTFNSKEQALKVRQSLLAKRPELEVGLVTRGGATEEQGVAEGSDNITAVFSGYGNYMKGRAANVFKHYGITVLGQQYDEDEDIVEYTVSGSKEALDQARAYLERSDQFGGMIIKQGVAEGSEHYDGIEISMEKEDDEIMVTAMMSGGRELGHVLFVIDGEYLAPQDLEVDERYQGQGIAATMYDYVKSKGYKIRRSGQQTDAGAGFWDKHKPGKNVWEHGVEEAHGNSKIYDKCWDGYRKVPGKTRGEPGSCEKIKEDDVEETSLATMRDFFAGDEEARDPYEITKQRVHFSKDKNTSSTVDKRFPSKEAYLSWLQQQKSAKKESTVDEDVIYRLDKDNPMNDTEVLVIGGAGRYSLDGLRAKARREAEQLAKDLTIDHGGAFRRSAQNVRQLQNTLNTIVAAYDELSQLRKLGGMRSKGIKDEDATVVREGLELMEKWTQKYKNSINCSNPKGFSQKAHCAGKKK